MKMFLPGKKGQINVLTACSTAPVLPHDLQISLLPLVSLPGGNFAERQCWVLGPKPAQDNLLIVLSVKGDWTQIAPGNPATLCAGP